jgi:ectoine hydroxylase-related dioxygenase (phytanoyl-CoA dioxygenase family)
MLPVLAPEIRQQLDDDGFVVFPGLLPSTLAAALAQRFDELAAAEGPSAGAEQHQEPGCVRVADLVNKDELFDVCWTHPVLLAAVAHLLGWRPFKLSAIAARDPLPDGGQQGLHPDWPRPVAPDDCQVCNGIWMLDAFTADNGATRVVPGSHRLDRLPYEDNPDLDAAHPRELLLRGPPGTLAVFSSHLWHGGTRNRSQQHRRSVSAYFVRREQPALFELQLRASARFTPGHRWLLGV